jgi:hypothetical protein
MSPSCSRALPFALLLAAATALADEPATTASQESCPATVTSPKPIAVAPVVLPTSVWEKKPTVKARVHFRIDESGHPVDVKADIIGKEDDYTPALAQAIGDAFVRNRYCRPVNFSTDSSWAANLLFSPGPQLKGVDGVYIQSFVSSFVGFEKFGHHSGAVVVRAVYGTDGRPRKVEIVTGSGDKVIDDKSLDMMASAQLLFQNGVAPQNPIVVIRPINFQQ